MTDFRNNINTIKYCPTDAMNKDVAANYTSL